MSDTATNDSISAQVAALPSLPKRPLGAVGRAIPAPSRPHQPPPY